MPKFRNITPDQRRVRYGFPVVIHVAADDLLDVPVEVVDSFACQPSIWQPEDDDARAAVARLTAPATEAETPAEEVPTGDPIDVPTNTPADAGTAPEEGSR